MLPTTFYRNLKNPLNLVDHKLRPIGEVSEGEATQLRSSVGLGEDQGARWQSEMLYECRVVIFG